MLLSLLRALPGTLIGLIAGACGSAMLALVVISLMFLGGVDLCADDEKRIVIAAGLLGVIVGATFGWGYRDRPPAWGCLGAEAACPSLLLRRRKMTLVRIAAAVALAVWTSAIAIGQPLVVGAKDFTEQLLISEMTTQLLRANGFAVYTGSGFTTAGVRSALEAGVVDLYQWPRLVTREGFPGSG